MAQSTSSRPMLESHLSCAYAGCDCKAATSLLELDSFSFRWGLLSRRWQNERLDEENRVRLKEEARQARLREKRKEEAKNNIILQVREVLIEPVASRRLPWPIRAVVETKEACTMYRTTHLHLF